ncbi:DsrE family protein [Phocoenobacter skyensis]|uniref:DsrE family protein n=1 Tax=Phocoenobacter skyensis TaxID=97481 RepID=A0A1H7YCU1_9PAST|nr:DsrE family protein [Pasteurella skyensis]MDP8079723.1 DsrE family protein [Pasteurella skyensis]MDP8085702.1 DsrE family protein [Pasteurella skyensis]MDP8185471.1 DsrE family protein [Pasteurella skyensis]QLB22304.1 sulfur reduction protein DsrE [Pasteurella skyensis]SEM44056.1 Predicted peroxiredoxin [Pasteurella skyensis]
MTTHYDYVGTIFENETNPNKPTVAFTLANKVLEKGYSATILLMVDAVSLAIPGKVDNIDIGTPFGGLKALQEAFIEKGGKILVCKACMVHNKITPEQIDSRFDIIDGGEVIDLIMNAKGSLQIS